MLGMFSRTNLVLPYLCWLGNCITSLKFLFKIIFGGENCSCMLSAESWLTPRESHNGFTSLSVTTSKILTICRNLTWFTAELLGWLSELKNPNLVPFMKLQSHYPFVILKTAKLYKFWTLNITLPQGCQSKICIGFTFLLKFLYSYLFKIC